MKIIIIYYLNLASGRSSTHSNLSVNRRFLQLENIIRSQDARISDLVNTNQQLVNTNQQLETRIHSLDARVISLENDLQEERNQTPQRLFGNFTFNFLETGNSRSVVKRKLNNIFIYIYRFIIINFLQIANHFIYNILDSYLCYIL